MRKCTCTNTTLPTVQRLHTQKKTCFRATWIDELARCSSSSSSYTASDNKHRCSPIHTRSPPTPPGKFVDVLWMLARERERAPMLITFTKNFPVAQKTTQIHFYVSAFSFTFEQILFSKTFPLYMYLCALPSALSLFPSERTPDR